MYRYLLNEGSFCLPEIGAYRSYGLKVVAKEADLETIVLTIPDISPDKAFVAFLAEAFEREQLEPIHLPDVLENMLP